MFHMQSGKKLLLLRNREPNDLNQPESDLAIGEHLLKSNECARNYSDLRFKILTTARS